MGLSFGWRANDIRESIWSGDEALGEVSAAAMSAWNDDGDASHLRPFCTKGQPQIIRYRNLNPDEARAVQAFFLDPTGRLDGIMRAKLMAFRIGVDFEGKEEQGTPEGAKHSVIVRERGIRMLASPFVAELDRAYPGLVDFYGNLVLSSTFLTEKEKKASSPPSTPTPSLAAESTAAITEPSPSAAAA